MTGYVLLVFIVDLRFNKLLIVSEFLCVRIKNTKVQTVNQILLC